MPTAAPSLREPEDNGSIYEEGESLMEAGRRKHTGLKSKGGPSKRHKALQRAMRNDSNTNQFEPTHSLLLSALRYWEVEHDLIEERVAAMGH
jgi:hypothetical protein